MASMSMPSSFSTVSKGEAEPRKELAWSSSVLERWMSQDSSRQQNWSAIRRSSARVLNSWATEVALGVLVAISFILVVVETDIHGEMPAWLRIVSCLLLSVYTFEVGIRLFVFRSDFFLGFCNLMDLAIVIVDWLLTLVDLFMAESFPSLTVLRMFRLLRLARSYKIVVRFPELALMVKGLASALSAVMYGVVLLSLVLTVWSICAVQVIHPVNLRVASRGLYAGCARCENAFASVPDSMVTLVQQIIAGDSWGQVTIPILEEAPWTGIYFAAVFVSLNLTIVNVMLALIVDSALKASAENDSIIAMKKQDEFHSAEKKLRRFCYELDTDGSGDVTEKELYDGIGGHQEFADLLAAMDIKKEDMQMVFSILDSDGSGTVNYDEFVNELFKMKQHDSHTMLVFIKHYVRDIKSSLETYISTAKRAIVSEILEEYRGVQVSHPPKTGGEGEQSEPALLPSVPPTEPESQFEGPVGPADDLGEELRCLRKAISDDLIRSMRFVAEQSELHTRLLASIAPDAPLALGIGAAPPEPHLAARDDRGQVSFLGSHSAGRAEHAPAGCGVPECGPAGLVAAEAPGAQPMPTSAWGLRSCCGARQLERRARLPSAAQADGRDAALLAVGSSPSALGSSA